MDVKLNNYVEQKYHGFNDDNRSGVSYKDWHSMTIHHNHPQSAEALKLIINAINNYNFLEAIKMINCVENCSATIANDQREYSERDIGFFQKIAKDDHDLKKQMLSIFEKALLKNTTPK